MIDPVWLRRRYLDDRAPVSVIAAEAGVDLSTVHRTRRAAGIPARGRAGERRVPVDVRRVKAGRARGLSWRAAAAEQDVDARTARRAVRAPAKPARELDGDWITQCRASAMTWQAMADEAGVERSAVLWQAAVLGLLEAPEVRTQVRRMRQAARLYRRGESLRAVADTVGVDRRQVTLWLRALGVEIRRPGRPALS